MRIADAINAILKADSDVTAICGTRIYARRAPTTAALPYITHHVISDIPVQTQGGPTGLVSATIQIDCWAATYLQATQLAQEARKALDNYSGTIASVTVRAATREASRDADESVQGGETKPVSGVTTEYDVWYDEAI